MFESITARKKPNWFLRIAAALVMAAIVWGCASLWRMTEMPLRSYKGPLTPLTATQADLAGRLSAHVAHLATTIRERNVRFEGSLPQTVDYLRSQLAQMGYKVSEQAYTIDGQPESNLETQLDGRDPVSGLVIVGAHYDSVEGTVGANDNASGVAATLELARLLQKSKLRRTVRFVFFVNEEPPFFQTEQMGSLVYARKLRRDGVKLSAMISLETIGYYSEAPGSQKYPPGLGLLYPDRGNFIGFVGNPASRDLVRRAVRSFRESTSFPSEGVAAPENLPGVGWSDHWSFWQQGYPAIMVTDTAPFRYPYYHTRLDTPDMIDFERMARVVDGMKNVIASLADEP